MTTCDVCGRVIDDHSRHDPHHPECPRQGCGCDFLVCPRCCWDCQLTVGSMFSGIGGLDLGLERAGMRVVWNSEIDPYCCRVLAKHWPDVPNLGDVTLIDWTEVPRVDVICGGYPCQPFSKGGLRLGIADERWMWPEFARCLRHLRPRLVVVENVATLLADADAFGWMLRDLHELGFDARWSVVSACSLGAPHTRERLFLLAYPQGADAPGEMPFGPVHKERWPEPRGSGRRQGRPFRWLPEPAVDRMADGVPRRLVRGPLHALGNAVVPQVAEHIGRLIIEAAA